MMVRKRHLIGLTLLIEGKASDLYFRFGKEITEGREMIEIRKNGDPQQAIRISVKDIDSLTKELKKAKKYWLAYKKQVDTKEEK